MKKQLIFLTAFVLITSRAAAATFYSENFNIGFPSGWVTGVFAGPNASWKFYNHGQISLSPNAMPAIATTSGFLIYDADSISGQNVALTPSGWVQTPAISCAGHFTVGLYFDEYFRNKQDSCFVDVSTNGFVTYTRFPVTINNALNMNAYTYNPHTVFVDISAAAANQQNVKLRFSYKGVPGGGYSWQIDNIRVSDADVTYVADSFSVFITKDCAGPTLNAHKSIYTNGMTIKTDFGDGYINSSNVVNGQPYGYVSVFHPYATPGIYNIKQVLYDGANAMDSLSFIYEHLLCSTMSIQLFNDSNSNCVYDPGIDSYSFLPVQLEVDSNNIPIDSIPCSSGFTYTSFGHLGDIYKFKVISLPGDLIPSCPVSGIVEDIFSAGVNATKYLGLRCQGINNFDLGMFVTNSMAGSHALTSTFYVQNVFCNPQNATVTMTYPPDYTSFSASPFPSSQSLGTAVWNFNNLSAAEQQMSINVHLDNASYQMGHVVQTTYSITPLVNDINALDNTVIIIDTVTGSFDPNAMYVKPSGCVSPGTTLEYTTTFENVGNGPAENIYILDTLPAELDANSIRLKFATHNMYVEKIYNGAQVIFKFSFPNIMLKDSSYHDECMGSYAYTINSKNTVQIGTNIDHRAGIYFDYNEPVITNTAQTGICLPATVSSVTLKNNIVLYPNPVNDELSIKTAILYDAYTVTNSMGQVVLEKIIDSKSTKINTKALVPGLYYISLKGRSGTEVRKFVKM